ncbi:MAG: flp pilus-assembly TadE/G-like family protein [Planctomycetaceae bacterium]
MQASRRVRTNRSQAVGAGHSRRGIATVWILLAVPVLITAFVVMFNAGNLWLAAFETQKAYEAGALAAVKAWGESPNNAADRLAARNRGVELVQSNTAIGNVVVIPDNNDGNGDVNDNDSPDGYVVLGVLRSVSGGGFEFDSSIEPGCGGFTIEDISDKGGDFAGITNVTITLADGTIINTIPGLISPIIARSTINTTDVSGDDVDIRVEIKTDSSTTFMEPAAFEVTYLNSSNVGASPIVSVVFDVSPDLEGDAHFDLDDGAIDLVNDVNGGWGPELSTSGALPTSPELQVAGVTVFTPTSGSTQSLSISFTTNDFERSRRLVFGADTDQVGPGGAILGQGNFGVRIHGTNTIPLTGLLGDLGGGSSIGPYNVTGDAFALFPCNGIGEPRLVNVVSIKP